MSSPTKHNLGGGGHGHKGAAAGGGEGEGLLHGGLGYGEGQVIYHKYFTGLHPLTLQAVLQRVCAGGPVPAPLRYPGPGTCTDISQASHSPFLGEERQAGNQDRDQQGRARGTRTIYLLVSVVIVFACAWLPLNLLNILLDLELLDHLLG